MMRLSGHDPSPAYREAGVEAQERASILLIDPDTADSYLASLRTRFEVTSVASEDQAIRALRAFQPTLVITELALLEGDGVSVCRQAKALDGTPPLVLATTAAAERVPDALIAGCDGVLLKPFTSSLLYTRIGRLLLERAQAVRERAQWQRARATFLVNHPDRVMAGTNIICHDAQCPSCGKGGVVSFDAAGRRRLWYACLPCRKVWMARSRDH